MELKTRNCYGIEYCSGSNLRSVDVVCNSFEEAIAIGKQVVEEESVRLKRLANSAGDKEGTMYGISSLISIKSKLPIVWCV